MANFPIMNPETLLPFAWQKKKNKRKNSAMTWENYFYYRLYELALTRYKWDNLPIKATGAGFYIEKQLLENGSLAFFKDEDTGDLLALPGVVLERNFYDDPIRYQINDKTGAYSGKILDAQNNAIVLQDNLQNVSLLYKIYFWASRLAYVREKIDTNVATAITPLIAYGNPKTIKQLKSTILEMLDGNPVIFASDAYKEVDEQIKQLNFNASYFGDKLSDLFDDLWAKAMIDLGINTITTEKKERLTEAEAFIDNDAINRSTAEGLELRTEAVKRLNELYSTNIKVTESGHEFLEDISDRSQMKGGTQDEHDAIEKDD